MLQDVAMISKSQSLFPDFFKLSLRKPYISNDDTQNTVFISAALLSQFLMATHCASPQSTDISEKLCQEEGSWIAVARGAELGFPRYFSYALLYFQKCPYLGFKKRLNL